MNKILPTGLMFLVLVICAIPVSACPDGKGERRIDRVVEKLELTAEQESQFRKIIEVKKASMKSFHEAQRTETLNQLKSVLNEEQLVEFEEISKRKHRYRNKK